MKPYNYFDDEEEQPQPSAHVRLAQLVAALQVNGAKLRRMVRRDEEIVEELRDYPNLRRAALKWLAVALFVLAVVIAIISFAVPFLILGIPIFDISFAFLRRIAHGQNPMKADRGHFHHRLIDMGLNQKQAVAALYVISSILGLSAVMLTSSGAIKAMLFLMALAVAAFLASRVIFRRDIDKALQAEKAAAEEKSTETATPAETVPAEPEEESNEEKKEEA